MSISWAIHICLILQTFFAIFSAPVSPEIPYHAHKLSNRVLFIKTGSSSVMSNVTVISASEGLVVIDAHYKPEWGQKIRSIAQENFGRKDFAYLIFTHAGVDHMGGSQVFSEAILVGHENCHSQIDGLHQILQETDIRKAMAPRLDLIRKQIKAGPTPAADLTKMQESLLYWSELTDLLAGGFRYTKPSVTFNDRLSLHMGDLTLKLCFCTPGYSESDAFIHVPQEKLLVVGDIFVKHRIPLIHEKTDVKRWKTVFEPFITGEIEIQNIISCHDELMTIADLKAQLNYLSDLWEAVTAARQENLTLDQIKVRLAFKKRYPHLSHLNTRWVSTPFDLHERNIDQIWKGLASLAD